MKLEDIFSTLASAAFQQTGRQDQPAWMQRLVVLWEFTRVTTPGVPFDQQGYHDEITIHLKWFDARVEQPAECQSAIIYRRKDWHLATAEALIKDAISDAARRCGLPMRALTPPTFRPEITFL